MSLTVNCRDVQANTNQNTNYPKCIHGKIQGNRYQFLKVFKSNITQKMRSAKYVEPTGYQILHYINGLAEDGQGITPYIMEDLIRPEIII